jgi:hypothetical protein
MPVPLIFLGIYPSFFWDFSVKTFVTMYSFLFLLALISCVQALYMDIYPGDQRVRKFFLIKFMFLNFSLFFSKCVGQELDRLDVVVFAASASTTTKDPKQKLILRVRKSFFE